MLGPQAHPALGEDRHIRLVVNGPHEGGEYQHHHEGQPHRTASKLNPFSHKSLFKSHF